MKRKPYTVQEKAELIKSTAIEKVANSSVTYAKEFRLFAVGEYISGKTPLQIFIEAGIKVNILGREQPRKCLHRWRKIHNTYRSNALLTENRGLCSFGLRPHSTENPQFRVTSFIWCVKRQHPTSISPWRDRSQFSIFNFPLEKSYLANFQDFIISCKIIKNIIQYTC